MGSRRKGNRERLPDKPELGRFAALYCAIVDSPEYERLTRDASDVLVQGLLLARENNRAGIFSPSRDLISARAKVDFAHVDGALAELDQTGWIIREGRWLWVRNQLRYDPYFNPANANHHQGMATFLGTLPRTSLLATFIAYYQGIRREGHAFMPATSTLAKLAPWIRSLPPVIPRAIVHTAGEDAIPDSMGGTIPHTRGDPDAREMGDPETGAVSGAVAVTGVRTGESRRESDAGSPRPSDTVHANGAVNDDELATAIDRIEAVYRTAMPDAADSRLSKRERADLVKVLTNGSTADEIVDAVRGFALLPEEWGKDQRFRTISDLVRFDDKLTRCARFWKHRREDHAAGERKAARRVSRS